MIRKSSYLNIGLRRITQRKQSAVTVSCWCWWDAVYSSIVDLSLLTTLTMINRQPPRPDDEISRRVWTTFVVHDRVRAALVRSQIASICDKLDHKPSAAGLDFRLPRLVGDRSQTLSRIHRKSHHHHHHHFL